VGFINTTFLNEVDFQEMQIIKDCRFCRCKFQKSNFSNLRIGVKSLAEIDFYDCTFLRTSIFHYIYGDIYGKLSFESCLFEKYVQFNSSKLYMLELSNIQFNAYVSFQEMFLDEKISIENVVFEKQANFEDIKIKKIDECDRKTIRTIKLQLQKAENKIDFNRFRVYEFNAYRKDIKKKLKEFEKDKNKFYHRSREPIQLKRDLFVLWISEFVSEYGTDWKSALKFTLISGFIIFSIFFVIENHQYPISWANWSEFLSGLFRFFLVTDFFNPLINDRVYLTDPLSWVFFIFGKIVIAFGLFEMIQSFRKFKA
jgi:hypothetical protein